MAAAAAASFAGKVSENGAEKIVTQTANNITTQIESYFRTGEISHQITFDPPLEASPEGTVVYADDFPELRNVGLEWFKVSRDDGVIYKYSFSCCNNKSCIIYVTDCEPDTYTLSMARLGKHNCDFNSKHPNIRKIAVKEY